jgi:hypothetical protein
VGRLRRVNLKYTGTSRTRKLEIHLDEYAVNRDLGDLVRGCRPSDHNRRHGLGSNIRGYPLIELLPPVTIEGKPEQYHAKANRAPHGLVHQRLTVIARPPIKKRIEVQGYPQAEYGRESAGTILRSRMSAPTDKLRKIHRAKTTSEKSS